MRYLLQSLIQFFLISSLLLDAQTEVDIKRKEFKSDKPGFNEAWKHIGEGDDYYAMKGIWFGNAFDEYLKAFIYNDSNPELNYKIGVSALFSDKKEEAANFLLKALELKKDVAGDILLLTGYALRYSGRFSEAIDKLNEYLAMPAKKPAKNIYLANKCISECKSGLLVLKDTMRVGLDNLGENINSDCDDYSEVISSEGKTLYFATRRKVRESNNRNRDTKYDENIFISRLVNGIWGTAAPAGQALATEFCETPLFINAPGDNMYIYSGYENNGDIKVSVNKKGKWTAPEPVRFGINSKGAETSFAFSPSGKEIYYVSDHGKDIIGGKDIYIIKKVNDRKWSKPFNAGPVINTIYDEESVGFSKTGDTLWFSSQGHNSIGGFDIFYSIKNQSGEWDSVINYGYPVNTPWDELFYNPSPVDDSAFYFASNRSGGFGGFDIYSGRLLAPEPVAVVAPPEPVIIRDTVVIVKEIIAPPPPVQTEPVKKELVLYVIGRVTDAETLGPVISKIDVIDISTDVVVGTTASSDVDGSYRVRLPAKKTYMIDLRATGFISDMKRINIPDTSSLEVYKLDVSLNKVKVGKKVVLNNILFETGKSVLTAGSYIELNRLFGFLEDNKLMRIEISGHTDKTGSEPLNMRLSDERAKAVVEYLVKKGIDRNRMESKGYGSLQPIADNSTPKGRAENRRVEFKILEF